MSLLNFFLCEGHKTFPCIFLWKLYCVPFPIRSEIYQKLIFFCMMFKDTLFPTRTAHRSSTHSEAAAVTFSHATRCLVENQMPVCPVSFRLFCYTDPFVYLDLSLLKVNFSCLFLNSLHICEVVEREECFGTEKKWHWIWGLWMMLCTFQGNVDILDLSGMPDFNS